MITARTWDNIESGIMERRRSRDEVNHISECVYNVTHVLHVCTCMQRRRKQFSNGGALVGPGFALPPPRKLHCSRAILTHMQA